jgi:RNA polymerase sigma factor (TIGR02999 family)
VSDEWLTYVVAPRAEARLGCVSRALAYNVCKSWGVEKMESQPGEVTQLLAQLRAGDREAESKLMPLVYVELRRLAAYYMRGERADHTLQPTALVHEAYLRLIKLHKVDWQSRSHFFATAATAMRRILVDYARAHGANKREGLRDAICLDEAMVVFPARAAQLIALDDALDRLAKLDARKSKIVELRFFGGLSEEEAGAVLGVSARTVKRDWQFAKAWLYNEVNRNRS